MEPLTISVPPLQAVLSWRSTHLSMGTDITSKINGPQLYQRKLKQFHSKTSKKDPVLGLYNKCERYLAVTLNTETHPRVGAQNARKLERLPEQIIERLDEASREKYGGDCRVLELLYKAHACQYYGDIVGELGCLECILVHLPEEGFEPLTALIEPRIQYDRVSLSALGTAEELAALEDDLRARVEAERGRGLPGIVVEAGEERDRHGAGQAGGPGAPTTDSECSEQTVADVAKVRRFMRGGWGLPREVLRESKTGNACIRLINTFNATPVTYPTLVTYSTSSHPLHPLGIVALASVGFIEGAGALAMKDKEMIARKDFYAKMEKEHIPQMIASLIFDVKCYLSENKKVWMLHAIAPSGNDTQVDAPLEIPPPIEIPELKDVVSDLLPEPTLSPPSCETQEEEKEEKPAPPTTLETDEHLSNEGDESEKERKEETEHNATPKQQKRRGLLSWVRWPFGKKE